MTADRPYRSVVIGVIGATILWYQRTPEPTILAFHIGQTFEEVVANSTFPVMEHSRKPSEDTLGTRFGGTWVTEPAVIIQFTDPKHGFTLPPTAFAAVTYIDNKAELLATTPMLKALPFKDAVAELEDLQTQFRTHGWEPWTVDGSTWFDLTPEGKKALYEAMFVPGYSREATLRVRNKYAMTFRIKCTEGCWTREPPYRFIIDIGISDDSYARYDH